MKIDTNTITPSLGNAGSNQLVINHEQDKAGKFARELEKAQNQKDDAKLYSACQELEAVFLNQILQSMRATIPKSDLMGKSFATDVWESMLYEKYADEMSKSKSTGLADIIYRQLTQKLG